MISRYCKPLVLAWAAMVAACLAVALAAQASSAAPSRALALPGPAFFSPGLVDDPLFILSPPDVRSAWLPRAQAVGSRVVRVDVGWSRIAPATLSPGFNPSNPADPRYDWSQADSAVEALAAHGQAIVIMARGAPVWAEGPNMPAGLQFSGTWMPDPRAFESFAHALALRYSGHFRVNGQLLPRVAYFQAWNEPNLPRYFTPQWERNGNGPWIATGPVLYRELLNGFYSGVKSAVPTDTVLAGGLAPYGDPPATGQGRMYPVTFLQRMFCLGPNLRPSGPCPDPLHVDVLDMHPYAISPTVKARVPGDISVPDMGKVWRIVNAAKRYHTILPAGQKPLWVTELDWATVPARSPSQASLLRQRRFLPLGFYELWSQRVTSVFWFQLRDPPGQGNVFAGGGLYYATGAPKPSAAAFRFPFIAIPAHHHKLTIWGRAPTPGSVVVQKLTKRGWRSVLVLTTTSGGVFYANPRLGSHLQLRAKAGSAISPVWATSGPM
jgi:hypothetical protein